MQEIVKRITSLILSVTMVLGLMPNVYAAQANGGGTGTKIDGGVVPSTDSNVKYLTSSFDATGYKIQLVFLPIDENILLIDNEENRRNEIIKCWDNANVRYDKYGDVMYIGNPVYLTKTTLKQYQKNTKQGYQYTDFQYGLGRKKGNTGIEKRDVSDIKDGISILTPNDISKKGSDYEMSGELPIKISDNNNNISKDDLIKKYFLYEYYNSETKKTEYIPRQNLAALVNYIATNGGADSENAILFSRVAGNGASTEITTNNLTGNEENIFDGNKYKGQKGEYRLIISPYASIYGSGLGSIGNQVAVTLRDMESLGEACYSKSQPQFFIALARALCFDKKDFFQMTGLAQEKLKDSFPNDSNSRWRNVKEALDNNVGCGIGLISSDMTRDESLLKSTNIGSITHIFLENDGVATASMEYIGAKNTDEAMQQLAGATLEVVRAGIGCEK